MVPQLVFVARLQGFRTCVWLCGHITIHYRTHRRKLSATHLTRSTSFNYNRPNHHHDHHYRPHCRARVAAFAIDVPIANVRSAGRSTSTSISRPFSPFFHRRGTLRIQHVHHRPSYTNLSVPRAPHGGRAHAVTRRLTRHLYARTTSPALSRTHFSSSWRGPFVVVSLGGASCNQVGIVRMNRPTLVVSSYNGKDNDVDLSVVKISRLSRVHEFHVL